MPRMCLLIALHDLRPLMIFHGRIAQNATALILAEINLASAQLHAASADWKACHEAIIAFLHQRGPLDLDYASVHEAFELLLSCAINMPDDSALVNQLVALCREMQRQGSPDLGTHCLRKVLGLLQHEEVADASGWQHLENLHAFESIKIDVEPLMFDICSIEQMLNWIELDHCEAWIGHSLRKVFGGLSSLSLLDVFGYLSACSHNPPQPISFEDIHCQPAEMLPANKAEATNVSMMERPVFWLDTLKYQSYSVAIDDRCGIRRIRPVGTFFFAKDLGGALGFVIPIDGIILVPLYSGMVSWLEGLIVIDAQTKKIGTILNAYTGLASRIMPELEGHLRTLLPMASQQVAANDAGISQPWILIGERINFGHAVINDSACVAMVERLATLSGSFNLMLGNHDYLSTIELLSECGVDALGCAASWDIIENHKTELDSLYYFPGMIVVPFTSSRPVSRSLDLIYGIRSSTLQDGHDHPCFLIQLDDRDGSRKCLNYTSILETMAAAAIQLGHRYLVLDGLSGLPAYSKHDNQLQVSIARATLPEGLHELASDIATSHRLELVNLDGLTIPEKLRKVQELKVMKAIVPYGSGSVTPIYLLNVDTGLIGSEWYLDVREAWSWHVTRYCHSYRVLPETYVESTSWSENGYIVSTKSLSEFLRAPCPLAI